MLATELLPLLIWVCFATCVAADTVDDVSSLATDLGPLLALFGELPTTQFMSQSMGWADNIILSVAPLGIITIILAAIRVGGPSWLKAIIGRARESRADVECELMSSTSDEVCELWDGHQIVREVGEGPIREFIILVPKGTGKKSQPEASPMDEAEKDLVSSLKSNPNTDGNIEVILDATKKQAHLKSYEPSIREWINGKLEHIGDDSAEAGFDKSSIVVVRNKLVDAPNLALNIHSQSTRRELYLVATFGILLQLGVLVYSGFATYYPQLLSILGGDPVPDYAFPCTAAGILVLVIGLLICSYIVEDSTAEERYYPAGGKEARVVWLQRSEKIDEDSFGPQAIFPPEPLAFVTTSRQRPKNRERSKEAIESSSDISKTYPNGSQSLLDFWGPQEVQTVIGAFISICGFVVQFIGLRSMHWSASIAQLGAIVVMVILRAWVRRHLAQLPKVQPLIMGYEMDWLAMTLGGDLMKAPWLQPSKVDDEETSRPWVDKSGWDWNICTVEVRDQDPKRILSPWLLGDKESVPGKEIGGPGMQQSLESERRGKVLNSNPKAARILKIRADLGRLAGWKGPASAEATSVAASIEAVMNTLSITSTEKFTWSLRTYDGEPIYFHLEQQQGNWKAALDEIDAALSLWLYSIHNSENTRNDNGGDNGPGKSNKSPTQREVDSNGPVRSHKIRTKHSLRLLGSYTARLYQDFQWWMQDGIDSLIRVTGSEVEADTGTIEVEPHRIFGHVAASCSRPTTLVWTKSLDQDDPEYPADEKDMTKVALATESYSPLKTLFAQYIFSAFMWAAAETMEDPIPGKTSIRPLKTDDVTDDAAWKSFTLYNSQLSRLAQHIQSTGLGTLEEIYLCMIPPLSVENKLPGVNAIISWTREHVKPHERLGHWKRASDAYLWLYRTAKTIYQDDLNTKATALVMEHLKALTDAIDLKQVQQYEDREIQELKDLKLNLYSELQEVGVDNEILAHVMACFESQDRSWECDLLKESRSMVDDYKTDWEGVFENYCHPGVTDADTDTANHNLKVMEHVLKEHDPSEWTILHYAAASNFVWALNSLLLARRSDVDAQDMRGRTPLHYACKHLSPDSIRILVREGADINIRDKDGRAPIHYAAISGHKEMVELLVQFGATLDLVDGLGHTPIFWAAYKGRPEAVRYLLKYANTNLRDHNGRTLLHLAAMAEVDTSRKGEGGYLSHQEEARGMIDWELLDSDMRATISAVKELHEEADEEENIDGYDRPRREHDAGIGYGAVVKLLLEKQAEVEAEDRFGRTSLHYAAMSGDIAIVKLLLHKEAEMDVHDRSGRTPFHYAALSGEKAVIKLLLDKGADRKAEDYSDDRTILHFAAMSMQKSAVQLLLDGTNINTPDRNGWTMLHWAAASGGKVVVELLLGKDANRDAKASGNGETALHCAAKNGHSDVVKLLLDRGADIETVTDSKETALHCAARNGHSDVVKLLLDRGADIETVTDSGEKVLHCAAGNGHNSIVELLLKRNVDIEAEDTDHRTALYRASEMGQKATVKLLLDWDAKVEAKSKRGQTVLHWAAINGLRDTVQLLLDKNADKDAITEEGETALHIASRNGHVDVVQLLLKNNTKKDVKDISGKTALHSAASNGWMEIVKLLLDKGLDKDGTDNFGQTALHCAAEPGHSSSVLQLLLKKGVKIEARTRDSKDQSVLPYAVVVEKANLQRISNETFDYIEDIEDKFGQTALHYAVNNGREYIVQQLLDRGADTETKDAKGQSALHCATKKGRKNIVRILLNKGAKTDAEDNSGYTALHMATKAVLLEWGAAKTAAEKDQIFNNRRDSHFEFRGEFTPIVQMLLDGTAGKDAKDKDGLTVLHYAAKSGAKDVMQQLLDGGVNTEVADKTGQTALHHAASSWRSWQLVGVLIDAGANVEAKDLMGQTALHLAAKLGYGYVVGELLKAGANKEVKDKTGRTAQEYAVEEEEMGVIQLFKEDGAESSH